MWIFHVLVASFFIFVYCGHVVLKRGIVLVRILCVGSALLEPDPDSVSPRRALAAGGKDVQARAQIPAGPLLLDHH